MSERAENILGFIHEAEGLKSLLRHSWLSDGRQESVAEHTWRSSLLVMVLAPELGEPVDVGKALRMMIIHDLPEVYAGDHHAFEATPTTRQEDERAGLTKIVRRLPPETGSEIIALWEEMERGETPEAKLVMAIDKTEVLIQHNEAPLSTWNERELSNDFNLTYGDRYCQYDRFMAIFKEVVKAETHSKLEEGK
jgi:putative hydrolases of HD superfamily